MGVLLSAPIKDKKSGDGENHWVGFLFLTPQLKYGYTGMQGWRNGMEDSEIACLDLGDDCAFFGVFDGHGGKIRQLQLALGHQVAHFVHDHLINELRNLDSFKAQNYEQALIDVFHRIDEVLRTPEGKKAVKSYSKNGNESAGNARPLMLMGSDPDDIAINCGCTATCVMVTKKEIICANAGDSRTVLGRRAQGVGLIEAEPLSFDHKPENLEEKTRIEKAGGFVEMNRVNGNLNLSRSLGDFEYKNNPSMDASNQMVIATPDIKKWPVSKDCQFMVLACDGIWDVKTNEEVTQFIQSRISKTDKLSTIMEELCDNCCAVDTFSNGGLGTDNMTGVVVQFLHPE